MLGIEYLIDWLRSTLERASKRSDVASASLRHAMTESYIYLGDYRETAQRDRKREADLARAWSVAAGDLRRVNRDLSADCHAMSLFWAHGRAFTEVGHFQLIASLKGLFGQARDRQLLSIPPDVVGRYLNRKK